MSRPYKSDLVDIAGILLDVREKAIFLNAGDRQVWLPLFQIEIDPPGAGTDDTVEVAMPEWLVKEKGLI